MDEVRKTGEMLKRSLRGLMICAITRVWSGLPTIAQVPLAQAPAPNPTAALTVASSQRLPGIWQGTLHTDRDWRLELRITQAAAGDYRLILYVIDHAGQSFDSLKTTFVDGKLAFAIDVVGAKYEGRISPDGKTISGTWTQGQFSPPLVLARTTPEAAWPVPEPVKAMAADASPGFDVATIKPASPDHRGMGYGSRGREFVANNMSMNDLIAIAYGLHSRQIIGAPEWFAKDRWNISGTPDVEGHPNDRQMELMLQKLLPDRFGLRFHHEQRELSVYTIKVAAGGPKMAKTKSGPNDEGTFGFGQLGDLTVANMTMEEFASWMQALVMDKPVVDYTGLTDKYDFTLRWTPDDSQFAPFRAANWPPQPQTGNDPSAPPGLYAAMPEQLGLKIEAGRAMDDVIVIDHAEKPSAN